MEYGKAMGDSERHLGGAQASGPFTVYVHYPFCRTRCSYCSFPTTDPQAAPQEEYADAVLRELDARAPAYHEGTLRSIYIGGGTPSLWQGAQVARVTSAVLSRFQCAPEVEVTVEANPTSLELLWLECLLRGGVNRLSMGLQSLDDSVLALLGRGHTAAGAREAVTTARAAGFANLGCDVIFGVPGQSLEHHLSELEALADLGTEHISSYGLTLAPQSPLGRAGHAPAGDDLMALMMESGRQALAAAGYAQYEVSNYCRPTFQSRHNSQLWAGFAYLGLGAFAHSMLPEGPQTVRQSNPGPDPYLELWSEPGVPVAPYGASVERVDQQASQMEVLMLGLRAVAGVSRAHYRERFCADLTEHHGHRIDELVRQGLLRLEADRLRPTPRGIWFADELALRILGRG